MRLRASSSANRVAEAAGIFEAIVDDAASTTAVAPAEEAADKATGTMRVCLSGSTGGDDAVEDADANDEECAGGGGMAPSRPR